MCSMDEIRSRASKNEQKWEGEGVQVELNTHALDTDRKLSPCVCAVEKAGSVPKLFFQEEENSSGP